MADAISHELVSGSAHVNLAQTSILVTEDRVYRCLNEWRSEIEVKDRWIAPSCLLASLVLTFVTSTFHDAFGVPMATWQAVFMLGILGATIWSIREVWRAAKRFFSGKDSGSIENLIERFKKGALVVHLGSDPTKDSRQ